MDSKSNIVFFDGQWIQADQALLTSLTPGVRPARGVFETMRVHNGKVVWWEEHCRRLIRGARLCAVTCPYSARALYRLLNEAIAVNQLNHARLRLSLWREQDVVHTAVVVELWTPISTRRYGKGFALIRSAMTFRPSRLSHIKSLDYAVYRSAMMTAREQGADEAVLCDQEGVVVEGAITNIFWRKGDQFMTPAVRSGCLNGITRQQVIRMVRANGWVVRPVQALWLELNRAQEIFVTNSLIGVMPVTSMNGRLINKGVAGNKTLKLCHQWLAAMARAVE